MRFWSRLKMGAVVTVVAGAVLVPLYGDPHITPVTHSEWARMLLRALGMDEAVQISTQASQVFSILSWRDSLTSRADHYLRAEGVEVVKSGDTAEVKPNTPAPGEVAYPVTVIKGGNYALRAELKGDPSHPASAEITRIGDKAPAGTFSIVPGPAPGWVDAGRAHLDPGIYTASLLLPPGTALANIQVVPPCLTAVEPPGGWKPVAIAQTGDVAVTVIKALDKESELPPAATSIEVSGENFQNVGSNLTFASAQTGAGLDGLWLKAGPAGLQAIASVEIPEAGLYTVSVFGVMGRGQSWMGDSCRNAVLCPTVETNLGPQWRTVMTTEFGAGRHSFTVTLGEGGAIGRLRLERKKDSPEDYEATLKRLGFDPGPTGPITRSKAVDAMKFVEQNKAAFLGKSCGDITTPTTLQAGLLQPPGPVPGPGTTPSNPGSGPPLGGPPAIPPQQPASPVTP
jgi:hypothetical protein